MKPAQLYVETVAAFCPHCGEIIPYRAGPEFWSVGDVELADSFFCYECEKRLRNPSRRTVEWP